MNVPIFRKIIKKLAKRRTIVFIAADCFIIALAVYFSFLIRFEGIIPTHYAGIIVRLIAINLAICVPIFYSRKLYSFTWAYVSIQELISLAKGVALSLLLVVFSLFLLRDNVLFSGFPRSTVFISYFFIFILCGGVRFAKRLYLHLSKAPSGEDKERTLIIGAGDAGEQIARSILNSKTSPYHTVGFVDDNKMKWGTLLHGAKVLGSIEKIPEIIKSQAIEEMIIALPSAGSKAIKRAVELGRSAGLKKIKVVPSIFEVINGAVSVNSIREVDVEDLLERDPVILETETIKKFIGSKKALITGGAGSIGSELCRQVAKFKPAQLFILDQDETGIFNIVKELQEVYPNLSIAAFVADICDARKINQIFNKFSPDLIFHAAAYKHVPLMEEQPDEAVKNNIFGTRIVAEAALANHTEKFIFISTDKAVNPTSIMGATKRIGEMLCQNLNQKNSTKFISVRFGNVLNSRGSVIPIFREQIKKGGPVEVTDPEMKRYFMLTSEACLLVMQAGAMGQGGEVFVLDMGNPVKILDLAREMIKLSGFEPDKDMPIVFIGRRPGEKLFEEILTAEEGVVATQNQQIHIAKLSEIEKAELESNMARLKEAVQENNHEKIINVIRDFVSSYNPRL